MMIITVDCLSHRTATLLIAMAPLTALRPKLLAPISIGIVRSLILVSSLSPFQLPTDDTPPSYLPVSAST